MYKRTSFLLVSSTKTVPLYLGSSMLSLTKVISPGPKMSSAFSTDGEVTIRQAVRVKPVSWHNGGNVKSTYETKRCIEWIKEHNFSKVALQFPDELLTDSVEVSNILRADTDAFVFVLGDTSYGSCCVDEVTAERCSADGLIHFGHACLSPTDRIPVLYVFGRRPIDVAHCCEQWRALVHDTDTRLLLLCDVIYQHAAEELATALCLTYTDLNLSPLYAHDNPPGGVTSSTQTDRIVLYVGESSSSALTRALLDLNALEFYSYDPESRTSRLEPRRLARRYHLVERAKDARVVGLLVGTLAVCKYHTALQWLKAVLRQAGKRVYTLAIGRLNAAKLANFAEVDVFVLVACPETSFIDSADLYKPVLTPFELEMACNSRRHWDGSYVTDFSRLLPGASDYLELVIGEEGVATDMSLITGAIRQLGVEQEDKEDSMSDTMPVACRQPGTLATCENTSAGFLSSRTFSGLEQNLGDTPVGPAVMGSSGIASGYTHEPA